MRIGITGGKGGTGKSTIATALATEGSLLVDMDVECPNDHLLRSFSLQQLKDVEQRIPTIEDTCTRCGQCVAVCQQNALIQVPGQKPECMALQCTGCGACYHKCPVNAIIWDHKIIGTLSTAPGLLSGQLNVGEPNAERVVADMVQTLEGFDNDLVIIDTAAGTHCNVIAALEICDKVFCVTEPTPLGAHDLDLILTLCTKLEKPTQIILNRSDVGDPQLIGQIAKKHDVPIVARIPYDESILKGYAAGNTIPIKQLEGLI
ncbi:MAG: 4Fe-4S binding protein [Nanobdellota archaeon]